MPEQCERDAEATVSFIAHLAESIEADEDGVTDNDLLALDLHTALGKVAAMRNDLIRAVRERSETRAKLESLSRLVNENAVLDAETQKVRREIDECGARDLMQLTVERDDSHSAHVRTGLLLEDALADRDTARRQNDELATTLAKERAAHSEHH